MSIRKDSSEKDDLNSVIASATRLGVEMNEKDAIEWLDSIRNTDDLQEIVWDRKAGVFGHKVSMLDFSDKDLNYYRAVGKIVEFEDVPGIIETALALSGSAAQSKIQTYPGDCDYFERVNIIAPTKDKACEIMADAILEKCQAFRKGPNYQLIEVKFGTYTKEVYRNGKKHSINSPISWVPDEIFNGYINVENEAGESEKITWKEATYNPGWTKLDWVVADPIREVLSNASNNLDVTWEGPDGKIVPMDGYLDPYFQEVYLDETSVPIFSKLSQHVSADALDEYIYQLEKEVLKYISKSVNYGKAAKRMYNVFRLKGLYTEAAFLRELFDEPTTMLYQVGALIRTVEEATHPGSDIDPVTVSAQMDKIIINVVDLMEGDRETEVVKHLLQLKTSISSQESIIDSPSVTIAIDEVRNVVNNFFYDKLTGMPAIKTYMDTMLS